MSESNHRIRETCLICEGRGRNAEELCAYCSGTGIVFSRTGKPHQVLMATGDCRIPVKKKFAENVLIQKRFS